MEHDANCGRLICSRPLKRTILSSCRGAHGGAESPRRCERVTDIVPGVNDATFTTTCLQRQFCLEEVSACVTVRACKEERRSPTRQGHVLRDERGEDVRRIRVRDGLCEERDERRSSRGSARRSRRGTSRPAFGARSRSNELGVSADFTAERLAAIVREDGEGVRRECVRDPTCCSGSRSS